MEKKRIDILDGFRVVAILIVMLYHYYSSFLNYYKYSFDNNFFKFGYLGVEFFFMISGFVIFMTLNKTENLLLFIKKRYLRLMPGMLICSFITFVIYNIFNVSFYPEAKEFKNFLFSNTFLTPSIPNKIFNTNFNYSDSSYWSLWVEIIFYFSISLLYYINKKNVILNFSILTLFCTISWYFFGTDENVLGISLYTSINKIIRYVPFINFFIWFLLGIIISKLYDNNKDYKYLFYLIFLFCLIFLVSKKVELKYFVVISGFIWLIFLYKNNWMNFLGVKFLSELGKSSYSVYLIHQMIGVLIIIKLSPFFSRFNWIIGVLLIFLFFLFGLLSYKYLEKPLGKKLHKILFKK